MAKLSVIKADNRVMNLVDGVLRGRFREGYEREVLMAPGEVYRLELDLWATSYRLAPGERLRLISRAATSPACTKPKYGEPLGEGASFRVANQSVYLDRRRASHVMLPLIPTDP